LSIDRMKFLRRQNNSWRNPFQTGEMPILASESL